MLSEGALNYLAKMSDIKLWYIGTKDTSLSVLVLVVLFVHDLMLIQTTKTTMMSSPANVGEKVRSATLKALHKTYILLPPPPHLPDSVSWSILLRLVWSYGLIPALSQWNSRFQLGPHLRSIYTDAHTHYKKNGTPCFLWLPALFKK